MEQIQASFEGVVNTVRLFNIEEKAGRFGLLSFRFSRCAK
jgi:hypothetical protein